MQYSTLENLELLLLIAAIVAMFARRFRLPYTVGLLLAGLGIAILTPENREQAGLVLSKDLVFKAFLPPLIFEAAFYIQWSELRKELGPTLTLATCGVLLSAVVTAAGMHFLAGWDWQASLVFGSMICATDPVSVIATFKEIGVHGRLRLLVESESLLNDGVAAVLFGLTIAWAAGGQLSAEHIAIDVLREVGGGLLCGLIVGGVILWIAGKTDDHLVEITFTTVAAYGSFLIAQQFHFSGVLSTLVCGLMLGNIGSLGAISDKGREAVSSFWEYAAFAVNSVVFLLIGMRIGGVTLLPVLIPIFIAFGVSTASRAVAVYSLSSLFRGRSKEIDIRHQHILVWGGLRGALTLALALGLPSTLPHRYEIMAVAFGAVALSILLQGLTIEPLLKRLGLIGNNPVLPSTDESAH